MGLGTMILFKKGYTGELEFKGSIVSTDLKKLNIKMLQSLKQCSQLGMIWQCLEIFWVVTTGEVLLASTG